MQTLRRVGRALLRTLGRLRLADALQDKEIPKNMRAIDVLIDAIVDLSAKSSAKRPYYLWQIKPEVFVSGPFPAAEETHLVIMGEKVALWCDGCEAERQKNTRERKERELRDCHFE